mmetsp:Transcript_73171/g.145534  ORF Transcript_73171/g.145534 Transcript_73171/m.145534 type:complete len:201 (-) Transcript_73171:74-676(-)
MRVQMAAMAASWQRERGELICEAQISQDEKSDARRASLLSLTGPQGRRPSVRPRLDLPGKAAEEATAVRRAGSQTERILGGVHNDVGLGRRVGAATDRGRCSHPGLGAATDRGRCSGLAPPTASASTPCGRPPSSSACAKTAADSIASTQLPSTSGELQEELSQSEEESEEEEEAPNSSEDVTTLVQLWELRSASGQAHT